MTGQEPEFEQCVSAQTPTRAAAWLRDNPPNGQIFNTFEWGDYLVWAGPPHLSVFVTSQAHLVPGPVWRDYIAVINVEPDWDAILARYQIVAVVIDKRNRRALIARLKKNRNWQPIYEDDMAMVFKRMAR